MQSWRNHNILGAGNSVLAPYKGATKEGRDLSPLIFQIVAVVIVKSKGDVMLQEEAWATWFWKMGHSQEIDVTDEFKEIRE